MQILHQGEPIARTLLTDRLPGCWSKKKSCRLTSAANEEVRRADATAQT